MKFSHKLLKKLSPEIKNKKDLIEKLTLFSFEAEDAGNDTVEIKLPPNRYSDAASHIGIAREISAIYGKKLKPFKEIKLKKIINRKVPVEIKSSVCNRMSDIVFEGIKIGPSPKWMQDVIVSCGMRPINNLVDITNYVMFETGQPIHVLDLDKMDGDKLIIRNAKNNEIVELLDGTKIKLDSNISVLADMKDALDIAGIKGGKKAEITSETENILLTAGNFEGSYIYKTSKRVGVATDASARFSRGLSPELVNTAILRAAQLIRDFCNGNPGAIVDIYPRKQPKKIIKLDVDHLNSFIGTDFDFKAVKKYLELLGFQIKIPIAKASDCPITKFIVEAPQYRMDIEEHRDLYEEVARLYGYNNLKSAPPHVHLIPSGFEDQIILEDKIKKVLVKFGLNEVLNNSFISGVYNKKDFGNELVELENPISNEFYYLRPSLAPNLIKNIESNSRFFDEISIFETGKIFFKIGKKTNEISSLGIILASKDNETFFKLKGLVSELFKRIGLIDYLFAPVAENDWVKDFTAGYLKAGETLKIDSGGKIIGYLGKAKNPEDLGKWHISLAEMDIEELLKLVEGEHEYRPLSKYPSMVRDVSILVDRNMRVGDITQAIQTVDLKYINDVDLIDEYWDEKMENKSSLTFRIVFQSDDRTLTDEEVNREMEKIENILRMNFKADIR